MLCFIIHEGQEHAASKFSGSSTLAHRPNPLELGQNAPCPTIILMSPQLWSDRLNAFRLPGVYCGIETIAHHSTQGTTIIQFAKAPLMDSTTKRILFRPTENSPLCVAGNPRNFQRQKVSTNIFRVKRMWCRGTAHSWFKRSEPFTKQTINHCNPEIVTMSGWNGSHELSQLGNAN